MEATINFDSSLTNSALQSIARKRCWHERDLAIYIVSRIYDFPNSQTKLFQARPFIFSKDFLLLKEIEELLMKKRTPYPPLLPIASLLWELWTGSLLKLWELGRFISDPKRKHTWPCWDKVVEPHASIERWSSATHGIAVCRWGCWLGFWAFFIGVP